MLPIPAAIVSASAITLDFNPSTDTLQFHEQHAQMHSIDMAMPVRLVSPAICHA